MGREELITLFSDMIQRGAAQFLRQFSHGPSLALTRRTRRVPYHGEFGALDHLDERAAILRTLIEDFGGEVVSSALRRRLVQLVSWKEAKSDLWVRRILHELEQSGAVTLEHVNGTDFIARIQPTGVSLAYNPSAATNPVQGMSS